MNHNFFFYGRWITILDKDSVCDLSCNTLNFPENRLVSFNNLFRSCGCSRQLWWARHIHDGLKELYPGLQVVTFHEVRAHLQLITYVKDFADKVEHVECVDIFFVVDHVVHKGSKDRKTLLNDLVQRLSVLIKLKFVPGSKSKEALEPSVN